MWLGRLNRRAASWTLILLGFLLVVLPACFSGRKVDRAGLEKPEARLERLRLTYPNGVVIIMDGWTLEYPYVIGEIDESQGNVPSDPVERSATLRRYNLDEATLIETFKLSPGKIAGVSVLGLVGAFAAILLVFAATSCPAVFIIDEGRETIVGEAYPGAIFRSVQRDDLLPLPLREGRSVTIRLRNQNPEVQYTDSVSLLVVSHAPGVRAMATHDGRPVLVTEAQAPSSVVDLHGTDVSDLVRSTDSAVWQSDLDAGFRAGRRDVREGLVATFPGPAASQALALDITAENTIWMSAVFHRGFSMMGSSFGPILRTANKGERSPIEAWRAREGVDLRVEVRRNGEWTEVALVQTPGMSALRRMAVPLGTFASGEDIEVRMTAGFGFWRIGSLALTPVVDVAPDVTVVDAQDSLVSRKDQRYHEMKRNGDSIDLTFLLPAEGGEARSLFLATSGYYNPLPPAERMPRLAAMRRIQASPGELAGFGIDLYAANRASLHEARAR